VEHHSVETIVAALNAARVRYLIAGGLAVVTHGYVRFTADVDLIVDLEPANAKRAIAALAGLGYRPRAPVPFDDFADPVKRQQWIREKALTVFSVYSSAHALTEIDLFVEAPLDFGQAYQEAVRAEVAPGIEATFIGLEDLLRLKRQAGRPPPAMSNPEETWEAGWDGHERQQLRRLAKWSLADKLDWLEGAHRLVRQLQPSTPTKSEGRRARVRRRAAVRD
jgi:hypothetical protein